MEYSAVTVQGGCASPAFFIKCQAAVQLLWQSSNEPIMPPLSIPGNASCSGCGFQSATTGPVEFAASLGAISLDPESLGICRAAAEAAAMGRVFVLKSLHAP